MYEERIIKNLVSIKKFFMLCSLLTGLLFSSVAFAEASKIILFCSSWSMKCREAQTVCSFVAKKTGIKFTVLDIDKESSQQKANNLGLSSFSEFPHLYIFDKKGVAVKVKLYKGETSQELEQEIMNYI